MLLAMTVLAVHTLASGSLDPPPVPSGGQDPAPAAVAPATPRQTGGRAQAVPEPAALLLVGTGLVGLALTRRRRRAIP